MSWALSEEWYLFYQKTVESKSCLSQINTALFLWWNIVRICQITDYLRKSVQKHFKCISPPSVTDTFTTAQGARTWATTAPLYTPCGYYFPGINLRLWLNKMEIIFRLTDYWNSSETTCTIGRKKVGIHRVIVRNPATVTEANGRVLNLF